MSRGGRRRGGGWDLLYVALDMDESGSGLGDVSEEGEAVDELERSRRWTGTEESEADSRSIVAQTNNMHSTIRRVSEEPSSESGDEGMARNDVVDSTVDSRHSPPQEQEESEQYLTTPTDNNTILSISFAAGNLGAAYYRLAEQCMYILHDIPESPNDLRLIKSLIYQAEPTAVIGSLRSDERFVDEVRKYCRLIEGPTTARAVVEVDESGNSSSRCLPHPFSTPTTTLLNDTPTEHSSQDSMDQDELEQVIDRRPELHLVHSSYFGYAEGRKRVEVVLTDEDGTEDDKYLNLAFSINLDCIQMVRAAGALLKYLDVKRVGVELEDYSVKPIVSTVRSFTIERMLEIDKDTYSALRLFYKQPHPSAAKAGRRGSKEGLSVFKLVNQCKSGGGVAELRRWFERPLVDADVLEKRQEAVSFFSQDCNQEVVATIQKSLKHIANLAGIFNRMERSQASTGDWITIYKTIFYVVNIITTLKMRNPNSTLLKDLDFNEMKRDNQICIRRGVDAQLDRKRKQLGNLPEMLTTVAEHVRHTYQEHISECKIIYLPLVGFLVGVPKNDSLAEKPSDYSGPGSDMNSSQSTSGTPVSHSVGNQMSQCNRGSGGSTGNPSTSSRSHSITGTTMGMLLDNESAFQSEYLNTIPGLEFVFVSDNTVHYRCDLTKKLDAELGDVNFEVVDIQRDLVLKLEKFVLKQKSIIVSTLQMASQLDCLISLALTARELHWHRPNLVTESVIEIDEGWHPLLEAVALSAVRNHTRSGPETGRVKILTGPNASGKSVYLKQVGIIAFLAHIGSYVPAQSATIGPIDRIFSRMHTVDCVLDGMSTFARDLNQMAVAQRRASGNSLVIADEFGKGTATEVGLALVVGCVEEWVGKGRGDCPHVFLSTHFHAIANYVPESQIVTYQTMEVHQNCKTGDLVFLYKLVNGMIGYSYASYTATRAGIADDIVARSTEIYNCLKTGDEIVRLGKTSEEIEKEMEVYDYCLTVDTREGPDAKFGRVPELEDEDEVLFRPDAEAGGWVRLHNLP